MQSMENNKSLTIIYANLSIIILILSSDTTFENNKVPWCKFNKSDSNSLYKYTT